MLSPDQVEVLGLLRRYGRNLHSFEVLEPGLNYWFSPDRSAAVAYVDRGFHWVAAGGPLCPREQLREVAASFGEAARKQRRRAAFFGVSHRFIEVLGPGFDWLQIGQQPVWTPSAWPAVLKVNRKLRNRIRKAEKDGLQVRLASPAELRPGLPLRAASDKLVERWVEAHALPPMRFMVTLELFSNQDERRYFVAEQGATLVGLAVAVPIYAHQGWLLEDMMVDRQAVGGASEALIDLAMRSLGGEGAALVSLGLVPLAGVNEDADPRHPFLRFLFRFSHRFLNWLYGFQGLYRFRAKLLPDRWEPVYLAAPGQVDFLTLRAVLMAFAGGWVPFFGTRTLRRLLGRWLRRRRQSAANP